MKVLHTWKTSCLCRIKHSIFWRSVPDIDDTQANEWSSVVVLQVVVVVVVHVLMVLNCHCQWQWCHQCQNHLVPYLNDLIHTDPGNQVYPEDFHYDRPMHILGHPTRDGCPRRCSKALVRAHASSERKANNRNMQRSTIHILECYGFFSLMALVVIEITWWQVHLGEISAWLQFPLRLAFDDSA